MIKDHVSVQAYPEGFEWINSSTSAFYFVEDLQIEDYNLTEDDWLIAYHDDIIVGARP